MPPVTDLTAPPRRAFRKRLSPPWMVFSVGAATVLLMVFIFPSAARFGHAGPAGASAEADSLHLILLRDLFEKGQGGAALHEEYVRLSALMGDAPGAFAALKTLMDRSPAASQASLRRLQVELARNLLAGGAPPPMDSLARFQLADALEWMEAHASPELLAWTAEALRTAGWEEAALGLYIRLGLRDAPDFAAWLRKASRLAAARGYYQQAADLLFEIRRRAGSPGERRSAFLDALRALEAADRLDLALDQAGPHLGDLGTDSQVLVFLVRLARSADRPKDAEKYARLLVHQDAAGSPQ